MNMHMYGTQDHDVSLLSHSLLLQVFGKGNAADCRKHVQTMNMMRGQKEAEK